MGQKQLASRFRAAAIALALAPTVGCGFHQDGPDRSSANTPAPQDSAGVAALKRQGCKGVLDCAPGTDSSGGASRADFLQHRSGSDDRGRQKRYRLVDLGALPGAKRASGSAINNAGTIVGASLTPGSTNDCPHTVRIEPESVMLEVPGPMPANVCGHAIAINSSGSFVYHQGVRGGFAAWRYKDNTGPENLGLPAGATDLHVTDINDKGQVTVNAASVRNGSEYFTGYLYTDGRGYETLPALPGALLGCHAVTISNSGNAIGGNCWHSLATPRAVLWQKIPDGTWELEDLNGRLPAGNGWVLRSVTGMQKNGHTVIGEATFGGQRRGYLLDTSRNTLGDVGIAASSNRFVEPRAINSQGEIVGSRMDEASNYWSFIYSEKHGLHYLDQLVDGPSPGAFTQASSINDHGQITGTVRVASGTDHVFRLDPIGGGEGDDDVTD